MLGFSSSSSLWSGNEVLAIHLVQISLSAAHEHRPFDVTKSGPAQTPLPPCPPSKTVPTPPQASRKLLSCDNVSEENSRPLGRLATSLVQPFLVSHRNREIRTLTASCIAEVFRVFFPDPPYDDDEIKVRGRRGGGCLCSASGCGWYGIGRYCTDTLRMYIF